MKQETIYKICIGIIIYIILFQSVIGLIIINPFRYQLDSNFRSKIDYLESESDWICKFKIDDEKEIINSNIYCGYSTNILECSYQSIINDEIKKKEFEIFGMGKGYCKVRKEIECNVLVSPLWCYY